jgi:cytochrome c oxidase cbb3-type subunit 4
MDDLSALAGWLRQLWVLWLMLLFLGIAVWAFRPKNKERLERHGRIPLEDNDKEP